MDADRKYINVLAYLVAQIFDRCQTGSVFLSSDDHLRPRKVVECLIDVFGITLLELMMIAESHGRQLCDLMHQVVLHLLG